MFEVLIYLFEKYIHAAIVKEKASSRSLARELTKVGFEPHDIIQALRWLEGIANYSSELQYFRQPDQTSYRILTLEESLKLSWACQGFLIYLEESQILSTTARELILDRVMAIDSPRISLEQLKWIIMVVLFHQAEKDQDLAWLESLVLADVRQDVLH